MKFIAERFEMCNTNLTFTMQSPIFHSISSVTLLSTYNTIGHHLTFVSIGSIDDLVPAWHQAIALTSNDEFVILALQTVLKFYRNANAFF